MCPKIANPEYLMKNMKKIKNNNIRDLCCADFKIKDKKEDITQFIQYFSILISGLPD